VINLPLDSFAFIALAIAVTTIAPSALSRGKLLTYRPKLAIALWISALSVATLALLAGTGILIRVAIARAITGEIAERWVTSVVGSLFAWLSLAILGILGFRIIDAAHALWEERRASIEALTPLLRQALFVEVKSFRMYIIESDNFVLTSVPFENAVLLSTATRDALDDSDEFDAAIAHERAHLRGKHSMIVFASRLAMSAAGGFRASQRFIQSIRIAIELVADDEAAQVINAQSLARALEILYQDRDDVHERILRLRMRSTD
jgi:Zn-dependent protease with chaperone function